MEAVPMPAAALEKALAVAASVHAGQRGKDGQPRILHSIRVMMAVREPEARVVALLHDVVEHGEGWTLERLGEVGFAGPIVAAVDALTRRDGEEFADFARRSAANDLARPVKIADLKDNLAAVLTAEPSEKWAGKVERYAGALRLIIAGR
jgi:(p)ppGpp synthase/HD superfamily hydrolase